nr:hypothetical protein [Sinorhizobium medicae]
MVAEVCLGKVGAVAAREVSRFARNSRDWQQLIEMCRVVDTVLIDQEAVYAPRQGNDRLLLGLKGKFRGNPPPDSEMMPPPSESIWRGCFHGHEAHRRAAHRLAQSFSNRSIILAALDVGLCQLRRD